MDISAEVGIGQGVLEPLNLAYRTLRLDPRIAQPLWRDMIDQTIRHPALRVFTYSGVMSPLLFEVGWWYEYDLGSIA